MSVLVGGEALLQIVLKRCANTTAIIMGCARTAHVFAVEPGRGNFVTPQRANLSAPMAPATMASVSVRRIGGGKHVIVAHVYMGLGQTTRLLWMQHFLVANVI